MKSSAPVLRAFETLWLVLEEDRTWAGIHAAEVLLAQNQGARVERFFIENGDSFPRIGRLRVTAQLVHETARRALAQQIETIFLEPGSPDRKQAIESLAKLRQPLSHAARLVAQSMVDSGPLKDAILPLWSLHYSGDHEAKRTLSHALAAHDPIARQRAAYALRWIGTDDSFTLKSLATAAGREPSGTLPRVFVISAALALSAEPSQHHTWKQELLATLHTGPGAAAFEAASAVAPWLEAADIADILPLLDHSTGDTRVAAALLILRYHSSSKTLGPPPTDL
jgi:hypothetical protein